jgi:hypothetical protein
MTQCASQAPATEITMSIVSELDIKKDSRNRITLPADLDYEYFHMVRYEDGHIELYPRALIDPTISRRTLRDMDEDMANFTQGRVGEVLDVDALERLADSVE